VPKPLAAQASRQFTAETLSIEPAQLKIGMFVDLDCSWFKHPFAKKRFKITTEQQLAIIQGLELRSVQVDVVLSDPATLEQRADGPAPTAQDETISPIAPPSENTLVPPTVTRYQEGLQQADTVYKQTLTRSSKALADIKNGSDAGLTVAKDMINGLTDLIMAEDMASAMGSLLGTQDIDDKGVLHAMNVAVLAMLLGRQFDFNQEQIKILGMAGLLHDIGEQLLPPDLLKKRSMRMDNHERTMIQQHVELGLTILDQFPELPHTVPQVIRQHHERIDGSGYPDGLRGDRLSLSSKIIMVVEEYESLINAPDVRNNKSPAEALSHLYLNSKTIYPEEIVIALIQVLSVYPPGTVVELNDTSVGLVVSINLQARMRPLIILYDPTVERENPNITDLSIDQNRSIVRSITRQELPQEVSEYLNLARWTGYFINSSLKLLKEPQTT
jgi:putative nucleotidyltransferase with HDIG domain